MSRVDQQPWAGATPADGVTFLTIFALALLVIPARYVIGPLGAAGTPAQLIAIAMLVWWTGHRLARSFPPSPTRQPIRRTMLVLSAAILASYIAASIRPISGIEMRSADRGLLMLCAWLGIVLVASDEIPNRARFDTLIRRLVMVGGGVAALGVVQFRTGLAFTDYLRLPGLSVNDPLISLASRSGFVRPAGTALHPIEFGIVLTMLLPLAIHHALAASPASRFTRWFPIVAIATAIPVSLSRSAIVCSVIVIALTLPVLNVTGRWIASLGCLAVLALGYVLVPGLLGSLLKLFTGFGNDPSTLSRTDSYDIASQFASRSPIFGRGFSTFLPQYRILDNQYLAFLIDTGVVGLASLIGLFVVAMWTAAAIRRSTKDQPTRQLAQMLLTSVAAAAAGTAFFDAFAFPMMTGLMFLMIGMIGGLRRLVRADAEPRTMGSASPPPQN